MDGGIWTVENRRQRNYRKIIAWERAHALTLRIYSATQEFPKHELYGLTSQIRRSAFSVGANIAEGSGRAGPKEFLRFLHIALGSAKETEYALLVARDVGYLNEALFTELTNLTNATIAPLQGLIKAVSAEANSTINSP
ncbi:MAG: four helix bundle protein [Verrucomicrobiales bacterium]